MKRQPGIAIGNGSGVGHFLPLQSVGCSHSWSQPRGTSLLQSLAPLQGISDGRSLSDDLCFLEIVKVAPEICLFRFAEAIGG